MSCANYNKEKKLCLYLLEKLNDEKLASKKEYSNYFVDVNQICTSSEDWKECPYYIEQTKKIG